jgi:hypothetical protein
MVLGCCSLAVRDYSDKRHAPAFHKKDIASQRNPGDLEGSMEDTKDVQISMNMVGR